MNSVDYEGSGRLSNFWKVIKLLRGLGDDLFSLLVTSEAVQLAGLLPQKALFVSASPQVCLLQKGRTRFLPISQDLCFVKFCIFRLTDISSGLTFLFSLTCCLMFSINPF